MRSRSEIVLAPALVVALALLAAPPVWGQSPFALLSSPAPTGTDPAETGGKPANDVAATAEPQAFPLSQLASAMEQTSGILDAVTGRLADDRAIRGIQEGLPATAEAIDALEASFRASALDALSARSIQDHRQAWKRLDTRLEDWEKGVTREVDAIQADRARVRRIRAQWEATGVALRAEGAPKAVVERAESTSARLAALEDPIRERLSDLLLLQDALAVQRIRVAERVRTLDAATRRAQERIFAQRTRPIWRIFDSSEAPQPFASVAQTYSEKVEDVREFWRIERDAILGLGVVFFVLASTALWLRSYAGRLRDGSFERRIVGERVFASATLVTIVLWLIGHHDVPKAILEIAVLALLVPLHRLLTVRLPPALHASSIALIVLVVLGRARGFVPDDSWAGRLSVLALSVAGTLAMLWTLRRRGPWRRMENDAWIRAAIRVGRIAAGALAVAVVANAIGQSVLAEALTRGTILSLYFAAVLFAAATVIRSWLEVAEASRVAASDTGEGAEARRLTRLLFGLTRSAAVVLWVLAVLSVFGLAVPILGGLRRILTAPWTIGEVSVSLGNALGFASALVAGLLVARVLKLLLDHAVFPRFDVPRGVPAAVSTTVQYLVAAFGFLIAVFASGIEMSRFTILASAIGVGVGFGLQNIVNNFVSGLILLYERPIQSGDTIEMGTLMGTVHRIGVRSSTVRTFDGAEVIVPNATLISSDVTNWTLSDRLRRVEVPVGVSYGSDPRKVIAILEEVARSNPSVLERPAPAVLFQRFGESSLDFALRVWTSEFDDWLRLRSDLHLAVLEALAREKIEIPFPQRDVHMK